MVEAQILTLQTEVKAKPGEVYLCDASGKVLGKFAMTADGHLYCPRCSITFCVSKDGYFVCCGDARENRICLTGAGN